MKEKKHKIASIHHLFVGIYLMMKGLEKASHDYLLIGGIIGLSGVLVIGYFVYEMRKKKENHLLAVIVNFSEAVMLFFTAYIYFLDGKKYLPYVTLLAAIGFLASTIILLYKQKKKLNALPKD